MFGRIKGYRSSGGLQFKADVFRVLLGISSEYGPVACLQPECCVAAVLGTGKAILTVDADKIVSVRGILQASGGIPAMLVVRSGFYEIAYLLWLLGLSCAGNATDAQQA